MPDYMIMIMIDNDFEAKGFSDLPDLEQEVIDKTESGEWKAYGVGLATESIAGYFEPDYTTFVWGCVADAGYDGLYAEPAKIQNAHLRELAEEQVAEYGDTV